MIFIISVRINLSKECIKNLKLPTYMEIWYITEMAPVSPHYYYKKEEIQILHHAQRL